MVWIDGALDDARTLCRETQPGDRIASPRPMIDVRKLEAALPAILGKTIAHVAIAPQPHNGSRLYLVFTDGTYYEFYAIDSMSGARGVSAGGLEDIRDMHGETPVTEISAS